MNLTAILLPSHRWVMLSAAMIGIGLIGLSGQLDKQLVRKFVLSRDKDVVQLAFRWKEIDGENLRLRFVWAALVFLVLISFSHGKYHQISWLAALYPLAVVPLATAFPTKLQWVGQACQHIFLACQIGSMGQQSALVLGDCFLVFMLANMVWFELTVQTFSVLLFHHVLTLGILTVFSQLSVVPVTISGIMLAFFCLRRGASTDTHSGKVHHLLGLATECANLVTLALESGDEFSADTKLLLQEILAMTTPKNNTTRHALGAGTESKLGAGTGSGHSIPSNSNEDPFHLSLLSGFDRKAPGAEGEMPLWDLNCPLQAAEAALERDLAEENPAWCWLLDTFADDFQCGDGIQGMEGTDASPRRSKKRVRTTVELTPGSAKPEDKPAEATDWVTPFLQQLVMMNFDAMGVVEPQTHRLVWANPAFNELATFVGGGDFKLGFQTLMGCFLLHPSPEGHRTHQIIGTASSEVADIWSSSRLVGSSTQTRVLWVMSRAPLPTVTSSPMDTLSQQHQPTSPMTVANSSLTGQQQQQQQQQQQAWTQSCSWSQENNQVQGQAVQVHGQASDFADIQIKVLSDPDAPAGPQGPRVQNMWRKYGQKILKPASDTSDPNTRTLDRLYYKCYNKECKARLLVDLDKITQEQVHMHAKGEHNHEVPVLRVLWEQQEHQGAGSPGGSNGSPRSNDDPPLKAEHQSRAIPVIEAKPMTIDENVAFNPDDVLHPSCFPKRSEIRNRRQSCGV